MVYLFLGVGILLTISTRFVQARRLGASIRQVGKSMRGSDRSSFRAVCTALAATVGTGNIAGVAGAIALGGPGAVFWMWVSAFLGMATKYAEVVLALRYRQRGPDGAYRGGPMYYIRMGMGERWRPLAVLFALSAVLGSMGMGNMAQVNTIAAAVLTALPQYRPEPVLLAVGLVSALTVAAVTMGGADRLGRTAEKLVPLAAGVYLLGTISVLIVHGDRLGEALGSIVRGAFCPRAVLGGGAGIGIREALRWGVARGVFSNEAGLGSAPLAHACAEAAPEEQGLLGIFEVFFDTILLCTLTALSILTSGIRIPYGRAGGAELAVAALETVFGRAAAGLSAICIGLLAMATLLSWQFYGRQCAGYLWGQRGEQIYSLCFLAVILLGATMDLSAAWALSDLFNGCMAIPNLTALVALRRQIK